MKSALRLLLASCTCLLLAWAWSSSPAVLTRGPYLQMLAVDGVTVVCRTDVETSLTLHCGEHAGPPWEVESSSESGTTHVFTVTGLRPDTTYQYALDQGGAALAGGASGSFRTAPPAESRAPFRFYAWGDSGTGDSRQLSVAQVIDSRQPLPDFALLMG